MPFVARRIRDWASSLNFRQSKPGMTSLFLIESNLQWRYDGDRRETALHRDSIVHANAVQPDDVLEVPGDDRIGLGDDGNRDVGGIVQRLLRHDSCRDEGVPKLDDLLNDWSLLDALGWDLAQNR